MSCLSKQCGKISSICIEKLLIIYIPLYLGAGGYKKSFEIEPVRGKGGGGRQRVRYVTSIYVFIKSTIVNMIISSTMTARESALHTPNGRGL